MFPTKLRGAVFWPAAAIVLAAVWVYSPAFDGGWIWDDLAELPHNAVLREPGGLAKIWFAPEGADYFPLKTTVQWVEWHLWGGHPLGYHLVNVGLHILSALLLWRLLRKLGVQWAWVGGLLFAVHPLAVESVAWISELKNTLSLPLLLLAMISYLDFDEGGSASAEASADKPGPSRQRRYFLLSLAWFLAAMLCKSSVVMFPVVLLLYAWWRRGRIASADIRASAPFFVVSLALGLATVWFQQHRAIAGADLALGGVLSRMAAAGLAIAFYFRQCVFPTGLLAIYPRWSVDPPSVGQFWPWIILGLVLAWLWIGRGAADSHCEGPASPGPASSAGRRLRRGNYFRGLRRGNNWTRPALFGLGTFLLNLAPVLGAIPMAYLRISWVADHLAYLPLVSIVGLAAAGLSAGLPADRSSEDRAKAEVSAKPKGTAWPPRRYRLRSPAVLGFVVAVIALVLASESRRYAGIFRDEETFWTSTLERNPRAWAAHNDLGRALLQAGRPEEARVQFEQALRLNPADAEACFNLGLALEKAGREPEAVERFAEALRLKPDLAEAHARLGAAFLQAGRLDDAITHLRAALRLRPDGAEAHANLGAALAAAGRRPEAEAELEEALRLDPEYPDANYNLANVWAQEGRTAEAIARYGRALRARPGFAQAHVNLGIVLAGAGRWAEARAEFERALRLRPDDPATRENLARVQAMERAGEPRN